MSPPWLNKVHTLGKRNYSSLGVTQIATDDCNE